jgi:hypothetical protein
MRRSSFALVLALALATGCARNAILELELELPPAPAGQVVFAVVEARTDASFDAPFTGEPLDGFPLAPSCTRGDTPPPCGDRMLDPSCSAVVSVIGDGDDGARPLHVRVRFCQDPSCAAPADGSAPEHRASIERAFYTGRYTQARTCIDALPVEPSLDTIERCEVRCRDGNAARHCRLDGTHFCEP